MRFTLLYFCLLGLLLCGFAAHAQRQDVAEWPRVEVVLVQGDTLVGSASYFRAEEVLQLKGEFGSTTTLTPVLVRSFRVDAGPQQRQFNTYLWNRGKDYSDYRTPAFFEQLSTGNYSLLKREILRHDIIRNDPFWDPYGRGFGGPPYGNATWLTSIQELFYVHTPKGNIVPLRNPKKDILRIFSSHQKQIKQYVKEKDLRYNRKNDLVRIVNYYNSLTDPNAPMVGQTGE